MGEEIQGAQGDVRLVELEGGVGQAQELAPQERVRLTIAAWVLAALFAVLVMAGWALVYGPPERLEQEKAIFEFVKTIAPPIVTLVIGFYFRNEAAE
jgi:hypothetical protein